MHVNEGSDAALVEQINKALDKQKCFKRLTFVRCSWLSDMHVLYTYEWKVALRRSCVWDSFP